MEDFWSSNLFLSPEDSDLEVHVTTQIYKSKLVIPVHSFMLKRGSKVFKTILEEDKYKEGLTKVLEIQIPGDIGDAFTFLRFLYTRKLGNLEIRSYVVQAQLAHLYKVSSLVELCEKRIVNIVTPHSVCWVYWSLQEVATVGFQQVLKDVMLKFAFLIILENRHILLKEEEMKYFLNSNCLNLLDEEQALNAVWNWARWNCLFENKLSDVSFNVTLNKLLSLVRWSQITNVVDAPWFHLVKEKRVTSRNVVKRITNQEISLKQFSKILNVQRCVESEDPNFSRQIRTKYETQDFWSWDSLLNPEHGDCQAHLEIQSNDKKLVFVVHGFILKNASKVFKIMLEGGFKESKTKVVQISIPGDEEDALNFFRYLYTKNLWDLDIRSYITLFQVAHMYEVTTLKELCEKRIMNTLTPYSVCRVFWAIENKASEDILTFCKDIMLKFAFLIFMENFHIILGKETMRFLLKSSELNVLDEEQALYGLWVWARANPVLEIASSKQTTKQTLNSLLDEIRFSKIQKVDSGAPWLQLVQENNNSNARRATYQRSSGKISLHRFSNVLDFSASYDFEDKMSDKLGTIDIKVPCDVLLTGTTILARYNYGFDLVRHISVNSRDITKTIDFKKTGVKHVGNFEYGKYASDFLPPVLLSRLRNNKFDLTAGGGWCFPIGKSKASTQSSVSDSGRTIDFVVKGDFVGILELYYIAL